MFTPDNSSSTRQHIQKTLNQKTPQCVDLLCDHDASSRPNPKWPDPEIDLRMMRPNTERTQITGSSSMLLKLTSRTTLPDFVFVHSVIGYVTSWLSPPSPSPSPYRPAWGPSASSWPLTSPCKPSTRSSTLQQRPTTCPPGCRRCPSSSEARTERRPVSPLSIRSVSLPGAFAHTGRDGRSY